MNPFIFNQKNIILSYSRVIRYYNLFMPTENESGLIECYLLFGINEVIQLMLRDVASSNQHF